MDLRIGPPTRARDVCPRVEPMLTVADLTPEVVRVIELRLNPCAIGSVKNWEFIGADLGASMVDIQVFFWFFSASMFLKLESSTSRKSHCRIVENFFFDSTQSFVGYSVHNEPRGRTDLY